MRVSWFVYLCLFDVVCVMLVVLIAHVDVIHVVDTVFVAILCNWRCTLYTLDSRIMPVTVLTADEQSGLESKLSAILKEKKGTPRVLDCETFFLRARSAEKLHGWLHSVDFGFDRDEFLGPLSCLFLALCPSQLASTSFNLKSFVAHHIFRIPFHCSHLRPPFSHCNLVSFSEPSKSYFLRLLRAPDVTPYKLVRSRIIILSHFHFSSFRLWASVCHNIVVHSFNFHSVWAL